MQTSIQPADSTPPSTRSVAPAAQTAPRSDAFAREQLLACARGELFGPGNARPAIR